MGEFSKDSSSPPKTDCCKRDFVLHDEGIPLKIGPKLFDNRTHFC